VRGKRGSRSVTGPAGAGDVVFTRHGARRGVDWLRESWRMFGQARARWLVLVVLYYLAMAAAAWLPLIGQLAGFFLKPVLSVGLLAAAWAQERGNRPAPSDLARGFHSNLAALLSIGLAMLAAAMIAMTTASLIAGDLLVPLFTDPKAPVDEIMRNPRLQLGLAAGALMALPLTLAVWFAPALVVFQDASARTALGASLRAALANWRPIAVFWIVAFALGVMLPLLVVKLASGLLPGAPGDYVEMMVLAGSAMVLMTTVHIADYVSYRDIFHAGETLAPLGGDGERRGQG
jgi:hypothetical protein